MTKDIFCCNCNTIRSCRLVSGKIIYFNRGDLWNKKFYQCPLCKGYVGCHPDTRVPMGTIPTPELRKLRADIHVEIDPIWRKGYMMRSAVYQEISDRLGKAFHSAEINSVDEAHLVLQIIKEIKDEINYEA